MIVKEMARKELEDRVRKLENIIAKKGVGSEYLEKAERMQRNLNLALIIGSTAVVLGITACSVYYFKE